MDTFLQSKYFELYLFLWNKAERLIREFEDLRLLEYDEFFPALEAFVEKLRSLSDHCAHEVEDLKPNGQREERRVSDELLDEAYAKCSEACDCSIGFLQRTFCLGFHAAGELQEALRGRGLCDGSAGKHPPQGDDAEEK